MKKYEALTNQLKTGHSISDLSDALGYEGNILYQFIKRLRGYGVEIQAQKAGRAKQYSVINFDDAIIKARYLDSIAPRIDRRKLPTKVKKNTMASHAMTSGKPYSSEAWYLITQDRLTAYTLNWGGNR